MIFEYKLKKNSKLGITAMSIVNSPAVLVNFITLSKEDKKLKLNIDKKEHIVIGPALIPNLKIFRTAESLGTTEDGFIFFSAETIKEMSELFMVSERMNNTTLEHKLPVNNLKLIESWIILDNQNDKAKVLGFDLPNGSWMVSYKVTDENIWNEILNKEFNGFSIEGFNFERNIVNMTDENAEMSNEEIYNTISDILDKNI